MNEVKKYLYTRLGEYSFYFEDIDSGYTYSLNEKNSMPSASCIKVPIAIALLKEFENGKVNLEDKIKINREDMVGGNGVISELDESEYSYRELLKLMLIQSDNTATNKIIDVIGMERINDTIKELKLNNTSLRKKMEDSESLEDGLDNCTSSLDMSKCFKILYKASYLNSSNSKYIIDILRKQKDRNKIPYYIPEEEWKNIAHKTGTLACIENDSGLIMHNNGTFTFTVLSKGLPNNIYGVITLAKVGRILWDIVEKSWR